MSKGITLRQFQQRFPTEDSCLDHLFQVRYAVTDCPKCNRPLKYTRVKGRRSYQCQWCANQLYPTAGTPFDRTRTSLRDWFYVMFLFTTSRNGVAAKRVEREIGVTYTRSANTWDRSTATILWAARIKSSRSMKRASAERRTVPRAATLAESPRFSGCSKLAAS
jgi:transposase-like protein